MTRCAEVTLRWDIDTSEKLNVILMSLSKIGMGLLLAGQTFWPHISKIIAHACLSGLPPSGL